MRHARPLACTRRALLQSACLAPAWLAQDAARAGPVERTLVVLQVRGGWDWLSILVPHGDDAYHALRPKLAIPARALLPLPDAPAYGWHPALRALAELHARGEVAVLQNVGHPFPDLSHFESEAKWHTADPAGGRLHTGWLARALAPAGGAATAAAVTLADAPSQSFAGCDTPAFSDLAALHLAGSAAERAAIAAVAEADAGHLCRDAIARVMRKALADARTLLATGSEHQPGSAYPDTQLGSDLRLCARLIAGARRVRVFHLSTGGYDTHAHQCEPDRPTVGKFADGLHAIGAALAAFVTDLRASGCWQQVAVFVHSEFGRAAHENRAFGTEHGHAGGALLLGGSVRGGVVGQPFSLREILANPLATPISHALPFDARAIDFRSIYATLLERWLGCASAPVLHGNFPLLPIL